MIVVVVAGRSGNPGCAAVAGRIVVVVCGPVGALGIRLRLETTCPGAYYDYDYDYYDWVVVAPCWFWATASNPWCRCLGFDPTLLATMGTTVTGKPWIAMVWVIVS